MSGWKAIATRCPAYGAAVSSEGYAARPLSKTDNNPGTFYDWGRWTSGNYGDTVSTGYNTPIPQERLKINGGCLIGVVVERGGAFGNGASSFYPVGVSVAMVDSSVKLIKEAVDSWLIRDGNCLPPGATKSDLVVTVSPGAKVGGLAEARLGQRRRGDPLRCLSVIGRVGSPRLPSRRPDRPR